MIHEKGAATSSPSCVRLPVNVRRFTDPTRQHEDVMAEMEGLLALVRRTPKAGTTASLPKKVVWLSDEAPCIPCSATVAPMVKAACHFAAVVSLCLSTRPADLEKDRGAAAKAIETLLSKIGHHGVPSLSDLPPPRPDVGTDCVACGIASDSVGQALRSAVAGCQAMISALTAVDPSLLHPHAGQLAAALWDLTARPKGVVDMTAPIPKTETNASLLTRCKTAPSPLHLEEAAACLARVASLTDSFMAFAKRIDDDKVDVNQVPDLTAFAGKLDRLLTVSNRVVPISFSGGGGGNRFDFSPEIVEDSGQPCYFVSAPALPTLADAIALVDFTGYHVCRGCHKGVADWNVADHMTKNHEGPQSLVPMTAHWVIQECERWAIPEHAWPIFMYTLESPLCYAGNAAVRSVKGQGRDPFLFPEERDLAFTTKHWGYQLHLRNALNAIEEDCPKGTVTFRAMGCKVSSVLYEEGSIVTFNQPSSTSSNPRVVKEFLGGKGDKVEGTILIIHSKYGKSISAFSQYPEEEEVLLMTNTQLRVMAPVGSGVKTLVATALRCDLSNVAIIEMEEVKLIYWSDLSRALTLEERKKLAGVLQTIANADAKLEYKSYSRGTCNPVTGEPTEKFRRRLMSELPIPQFFETVKAATKSNKTWRVILHRLPASAIDVGFLTQAISECQLKTASCSDQWKSGYGYYDALPDSLGIVEAVMGRYGTAFAIGKMGSNLAAPAAREGTLCALAFSSFGTVDQLRAVMANCDKEYLSLVLRFLAGASRPRRVITFLEALADTRGAAVMAVDCMSITALHIACRTGNVETVNALFVVNDDAIITQDSWRLTPLLIACEMGHLPVVRELLKAKPSVIDVVDEIYNRSALYVASREGHLSVVRELLQAKPSIIDIVTEENWSALYVASREGYLNIVRELLKAKPSIINVVTSKRWSALYVASQNGRLSVVRELLKAEPSIICVVDENNRSALYAASFNGHLSVVRELLKAKPSAVNISALAFAFAFQKTKLRKLKKNK